MIRIVCLALLLSMACKKQESSPGPLAPLPPDGSGSASAAPPSDPTPPPSTLSDADLDKLMRETVAFFTAVGTAIEAAGSDCPKMAAEIDRTVNENSEFMARVRTVDSDPTAGDRGEAWMTAHKDEVKPVFDKIGAALTRCGSDPAVQAAFEKMGGM